jgi:hypothetical protein
MRRTRFLSILLAGITFFCSTTLVKATIVWNQDSPRYQIKVNDGHPNSYPMGVLGHTMTFVDCRASSCTFEIFGSRVRVTQNSRVTIHGGRFVKVEELPKKATKSPSQSALP